MAHKPFDVTPPKSPKQGTNYLRNLPEHSRKEREAGAEKKDILGSIIKTLGWMKPSTQETHHIKGYSDIECNTSQGKKKVGVPSQPAEDVVLRRFEKKEGPIIIHLTVWDYLTSKRQMMQASIFKHKLPYKADSEGELVFMAHQRMDKPASITVYEPDPNGWERYFSVFVANNKSKGAVRDY